MSAGDDNYAAETLADEYRVHLLSRAKLAAVQLRILEIKEVMCAAEFVGTPDEVSTAIGKFHLLKGKLDAFQEILDDHQQAQDALQATAVRQ